MLTADGEKSKSPKRAKVRFLLATLTYRSLASKHHMKAGTPHLHYCLKRMLIDDSQYNIN